MARRKREAPPSPDDAAVAERVARQLALRLRLAVMAEPELRRLFEQATRNLPADPSARLIALLDLADEIRPQLPAGVVQHTLPETFNRWRPDGRRKGGGDAA